MNKTLIKDHFGHHLIIAGSPELVKPLHLTLTNIGACEGSLLDLGNEDSFVFFMTTDEKFVHGLSMAKTIADNSDRFKGVKGGAINHYRMVVKEFLNNIPDEQFYAKCRGENYDVDMESFEQSEPAFA